MIDRAKEIMKELRDTAQDHYEYDNRPSKLSILLDEAADVIDELILMVPEEDNLPEPKIVGKCAGGIHPVISVEECSKRYRHSDSEYACIECSCYCGEGIE